MKILIAGDFVPRNRLATFVTKGIYSAVFGEVRDVIDNVDYAIINFESPIVENSDTPINKCGPNLKCTADAVKAIKYAGFKCATLANNHIRDFGDSAVARTIKVFNENGLDCVGVGENLATAARILYRNINNNTLAIINCCEHEFSIASERHYGANPLNPVSQYYSIREAREIADYVLVIVHGGHEHYQLPSPRMQDTYRFFVDAGADIVVNHHQHCYSGFEYYNNKPIVYGTGNFCMDKYPIRINQNWNYGYMVIWDTDSANTIKILPYNQCGEEPTVHLLDSTVFDKQLEYLNRIITDRKLLEKETNSYYDSCIPVINSVIEPFNNKYISFLRGRHLFPSFVSQKWLLKLHDYILCESHRDKLSHFFKNINDN